MAVYCFNEKRVAVTAQPSCHHNMDLELARLTKMMNPQMGSALGDCPPRPGPDEYGHGNWNNNPSRHHPHNKEAVATNQLELGWGLWAVGRLLCCSMGKTRSRETDKLGLENGKSKTSTTGGVLKGAMKKRKRKKLCEYDLTATVRAMVRARPDDRNVTFNQVVEVLYVDTCQQLYPLTLNGVEMKRRAFWSVYDTEGNQLKWSGHFETYDKEKNGRGPCECLGCLIDGRC